MRISDWSSDVCSSDLGVRGLGWVGLGLGEELGEEWGQGLGAGGVEGVGADAVEAGGEVAFVFAVAAEVEEAVFVDEGGVGGGFGGGGVGVGDPAGGFEGGAPGVGDRQSTRLNSSH